MSDSLPTVWPIDPHTTAKHAILKSYLDAWLAILTNQAAKLRRQYGQVGSHHILYIDGFSGPGVYEGGEPGSPVLAIDAAAKHSQQFPFPVEMMFIEERSDRFDKLAQVMEAKIGDVKSSKNLKVVKLRKGDCNEVVGAMLDDYSKRDVKFGPALAFLDQFGYGSVSMELIARILAVPQCEAFTYLDYKDINRFITDKHKEPALIRAFGGEQWKECISLPERERRSRLLELYIEALKQQGNASFVTSFLMFDHNNIPLYWLLFCTNSLRGLEEMKKAMWRVDKSGSFRFSDRDNPGQLKLLDDTFDQEWLSEEMKSKLGGKTLNVKEVWEFVLTKTPCYLFKTALAKLESAKVAVVVTAPIGRKNGKYPDDDWEKISLKFEKRLL